MNMKNILSTDNLEALSSEDECKYGVGIIEITKYNGKKKLYVYNSRWVGLYYKVNLRSLNLGRFHLPKMQEDYNKCISTKGFLWKIGDSHDNLYKEVEFIVKNFKGLYNKHAKLITSEDLIKLWPLQG
jgi:hypothetical protein